MRLSRFKSLAAEVFGVSTEVVPMVGNPSPDSPSLRVLLVDDHEDTNRSMQLLLRRRGYQVETALDMAGAVELCTRERFDVLVCDLGLPDGSGLDLLAKLVDHPPTYGGIMVSGYGEVEDIARSRVAGYQEHLAKPVDVARLEAAIRQVAGLPPK